MDSQNNGKKTGPEFREFFVDELKDIYWAAKHFHSTLPKLQKGATNNKLISALEKHSRQTQKQVERVENTFQSLDKKPQTKKCEAMEGILKEAQSIKEETHKDTYTRDAALILAVQKAEHYEIATYGTLRIFADHMGENRAKTELEKNLEEVKSMDAELTEIAQTYINEKAALE